MFIPTTTLTQGGSSLLTAIFDETKLGAATTFDTGAITTDLAHLYVLADLRTTEAVTISSAVLTLNADTGNNYDQQALRGRNVAATAASSAATASLGCNVAGGSLAAGVFGPLILWIPNYANTVSEKSIIFISGAADETAANSNAEFRTAHWRSTAAVNQLTFTGGSGSDFAIGSRVTVYGIGI
jgi:hypothetical protein